MAFGDNSAVIDIISKKVLEASDKAPDLILDLASLNSLSSESRARLLILEEKYELRRDMSRPSTLARAKLKCRCKEKAKSSEHGTDNGTTTEPSHK